MEPAAFRSPNVRARSRNPGAMAAMVFCAAIWGLAADGAYRLTHDNGHGIRRALQAKASHVVRRIGRTVERRLG